MTQTVVFESGPPYGLHLGGRDGHTVVESVDPDSIGAQKGIAPGSEVISINEEDTVMQGTSAVEALLLQAQLPTQIVLATPAENGNGVSMAENGSVHIIDKLSEKSEGLGQVFTREESNKLRMKLRAAIRVVQATTNRNERRVPGGRRHSVAYGATLEFQQAEAEAEVGRPSMCAVANSYLSHRAQTFFEHKYHALGKWIGRKPQVALWLGALVLLSGIPGTVFLQGEANVLWISFDTRIYENFGIQDNEFFREYEDAVHLEHGIHHPDRTGVLFLTPKAPQGDAPDPILSSAFLKKSLAVFNYIYDELTVPDPTSDATLRFANVCTKNVAGECSSRAADIFSPSSQVNHSAAALAALTARPRPPSPAGSPPFNDYYWGLMSIEYGSMLAFNGGQNLRGLLEVYLPGAGREAYDNLPPTQWQPTALVLVLSTAHPHSEAERRRVEAWESKVISSLEGAAFPNADDVDITFKFEASVQAELAKSIEGAVPMIFVTLGVMILYALVFLATQSRMRQGETTILFLVLQGTLVPALAGISSLGWMFYFGFRVNVLCAFVVFLVLCVGVDCTFIFVSAMKAVGPEVVDITEATAMALAEAGPAVTLTSLTSLTAFFLSAAFSSSMPGMLVFNLCMGVALTLNVIGFVLFFTAFLALNEQRISEGLQDLHPFNYQVGPHEPPECLKKKPPCKGPLPKACDVSNMLRLIVTDRYAPLLATSKPCQICGALVMLASLAVSIAFIPTVGLGIPASSYASDTSYLLDVFTSLDDHMNATVPLSVNMVVQGLDMGNGTKIDQFIEEVIDPILDRDDVYTSSCFVEAYAFYRHQAGAAATAGGGGIGGGLLPWSDWLHYSIPLPASTASPSSPSSAPLRYINLGASINPRMEVAASGTSVPSSIDCSFIIAQPTRDIKARLAQAQALQIIGSTAQLEEPARVHIFSHSFAEAVSNDQDIVRNITISVIVALCAVSLVLLLALPVVRAIITTCNIGLVVINLLGFMGYAGFTYNPISFCTLTMAIGFCVDYTVEIMHFSSSAGGSSIAMKMQAAIVACGYDVGHGCITAFVGVFLVSFVPGEAFRIFGHLAMVMCVYGGSYALWCLPSVMILSEEANEWLCRGKSKQAWGDEIEIAIGHKAPGMPLGKAQPDIVSPRITPGICVAAVSSTADMSNAD